MAKPGIKTEMRTCKFNLTEIREAKNAKNEDVFIIEGLAAPYNSPSDSESLSWFTEIIRPGAFKNALAEMDDVRALFNHDSNFVLGRTKSGTLILTDSPEGLRVKIEAPKTQSVNDFVVTPMRRGDIDQMSFNFCLRTIDGDIWTEQGDNITRELIDLKLYDVSIVTYAWYQDTTVNVREKATLDNLKQEYDAKKASKTTEAKSSNIQEARRRRELELKIKEVSL